MKLASFNHGRVGCIENSELIDLTDLVTGGEQSWPPVAMIRLIANFNELKTRIAAGTALPRLRLQDAALETPIQWPNKVIAFPANYREHIAEMKTGTGLISSFSADGQGFFLKANSSLSGPADAIVLPNLPTREVHHECELAIIIGRTGRHISRANAYAHIFGYACLIDVVVRGKEERVMRKSFDTFCPMGPYIVTSDEVASPETLQMELAVNGVMRQRANTRDLIVDIPTMIEMASSVMTLFPGDIIASGTPSGVGPLHAGDKVTIAIENVGSMDLDVIRSDEQPHAVWRK
jgi:2-keto-4-pentenoate hydratase/2-oxohepta-3-ene-1,7-dioic acid hydratase in catechol pathway